VIQIDKVIYRP